MSYITIDELRVASPCTSAVWSDENAEPFARHCKTCDKNVYNLSLMTLDEANELIREKRGDLCISLYHRLNGKVITADVPVAIRGFYRKYLKARAKAIAVAFAIWGFITGTSSCDNAVHGVPVFQVDTNFNAVLNGHQWQPWPTQPSVVGLNDTTVNEIWIEAKRASESMWVVLDSSERTPGTYENHHGIFEAGGYSKPSDSNKYIWYSGELTITSISNTHASGTFWFNADRTTPTAETVRVTDGSFDVPIEYGKIQR